MNDSFQDGKRNSNNDSKEEVEMVTQAKMRQDSKIPLEGTGLARLASSSPFGEFAMFNQQHTNEEGMFQAHNDLQK